MCMHTHIALCMDTSVHMHTHVHVSAPVCRYEHTSLLVHIICARTPVYSHTDYYVYTHTSDRTHITLLANISVYMDVHTHQAHAVRLSTWKYAVKWLLF